MVYVVEDQAASKHSVIQLQEFASQLKKMCPEELVSRMSLFLPQVKSTEVWVYSCCDFFGT